MHTYRICTKVKPKFVENLKKRNPPVQKTAIRPRPGRFRRPLHTTRQTGIAPQEETIIGTDGKTPRLKPKRLYPNLRQGR